MDEISFILTFPIGILVAKVGNLKQEKTYTIMLTEADRIKVRQVRSGPKIMQFSVQYEAHVNNRWRVITRFDNAHNSPHRHVYYPYKPKYKYTMNTQNSNNAFTEAQHIIKKNFKRMRESYIILLNKGRR